MPLLHWSVMNYQLISYIYPFDMIIADVIVTLLTNAYPTHTHSSSPIHLLSSPLKGYSAPCPLLMPAHPTCPTQLPPPLIIWHLRLLHPSFLTLCPTLTLGRPRPWLQPRWACCPLKLGDKWELSYSGFVLAAKSVGSLRSHRQWDEDIFWGRRVEIRTKVSKWEDEKKVLL